MSPSNAAGTPDRTMVIVFSSRLLPEADPAEYEREVARIFAIAEAMPGFRSIKDFSAADGERLAVVEFESERELEAWRDHAEHRLAQAAGRDRYYSEYHLQICQLRRESIWHRRD